MKKLGKKENKNVNSINCIKDNGKKIEDEINIANCMNKYFCEVDKKLSEQLQTCNKNPKLIKRNAKSIFLNSTNAIEISSLIKDLKDKAGGEDKINAKTVKVLENYLTIPLTHIFNLSIEKSVWPDALIKTAQVFPVHKQGDRTNLTNYRPISIISNIAKIFERIIYNGIVSFLDECKILSENQFCFIKNRGTKDALNKIADIIYNNLDKSRPIIAVFLNLAKAFDTLNHELLLEKLERNGIRCIVFVLIKSYLTNRQQKVIIKEKYSDTRIIDTGEPQGTILGPLLFILYVNDLLLDMQNDSILSYADDTVIISDDDTWSLAQEKMNKNLDKVANWLILNNR